MARTVTTKTVNWSDVYQHPEKYFAFGKTPPNWSFSRITEMNDVTFTILRDHLVASFASRSTMPEEDRFSFLLPEDVKKVHALGAGPRKTPKPSSGGVKSKDAIEISDEDEITEVPGPTRTDPVVTRSGVTAPPSGEPIEDSDGGEDLWLPKPQRTDHHLAQVATTSRKGKERAIEPPIPDPSNEAPIPDPSNEAARKRMPRTKVQMEIVVHPTFEPCWTDSTAVSASRQLPACTNHLP